MSDLSKYYTRLSAAIESSSPVWQAVVVETDGSTPARVGMKLAVQLDGDTFGNLGGGEMEYLVINAIRKEQPKAILKWTFSLDEQGKTVAVSSIQTSMICGGKVEVLIEPLFAPHPLYIIGAGHCGRALAEFAVKADFQVTVIDNREDLLQPEAFPSECRLVHNDYSSLEDAIRFNDHAFIVIMTYGHVHDRQVLEYSLKRKFRYLGMIGSKKKVAETLKKVKANGVSDENINRIHAPIGLPIHSHTPYEIAVSILAELIQIKNSPLPIL
jgi:xanthine dehydrogenase accessory factor